MPSDGHGEDSSDDDDEDSSDGDEDDSSEDPPKEILHPRPSSTMTNKGSGERDDVNAVATKHRSESNAKSGISVKADVTEFSVDD